MTIIDDLNAHLQYLEERCNLIPILEQRLEDANRATREARRQLAVSEALRERPTLEAADADLQVIALIANGADLAQVARETGLNQNTLKSRLKRLYKAYAVDTHARLVVSALRQGDLDADALHGTWEGPEPSEQAKRVLQAVADHGTNKAAGAVLGITGNTVAVHLHRLSYMAGTGLKVQLVVRAYKKGWVE